MSIRYREPSIDASYQVSVHLAKWFQRRRFFRNRPIRNKNCLSQPCLTNREEMNTFHRCFLPSFGSLGNVVSEEKIFRNRPIRNKNCLWQPCLTNWEEINIFHREPSVDAFYQISVHLVKRFQTRRFFLEINQSETRMACGGHVC